MEQRVNSKLVSGIGTEQDERTADSRTFTALYLMERNSSGTINCSNNGFRPRNRLDPQSPSVYRVIGGIAPGRMKPRLM